MLSSLAEARKKAGSLMPYAFLNKDGDDPAQDVRKSRAAACNKAGIWEKLLHDC